MTETGNSYPSRPPVKIQLKNDKAVEFLRNSGDTFSLLNQALIPKSENHLQAIGATIGQPENAFFLKLLQCQIKKKMGIHQFLYLPNSPKSVLGRDLLENLRATVRFRKRKLKFKVREDK